jgi:flagellum-specific ATP synthase
MQEIVTPGHVEMARRFRQTLSTYQHHRDLIAIGAYQRGSDPRVDAAIALWPRMQKFLQQGMHQRLDFAASLTALQGVLTENPEPTPEQRVSA